MCFGILLYPYYEDIDNRLKKCTSENVPICDIRLSEDVCSGEVFLALSRASRE